MRKVYGTVIDLPAESGPKAEQAVVQWLRGVLHRHRIMDRTAAVEELAPRLAEATQGARMVATRRAGDGWQMFDVAVVEPASEAPDLRWRTDLSLLIETGQVSIDVSLAVESASFLVAPLRAAVRPQRVIADLLGLDGAQVAGMPVSAHALPFGADEAQELIEVLLAPTRRLPVIVLAPRPGGDPCLVAADVLARRLVGIALVAEITDPEATFQLSDRLGLRLSCYDGAARIYWPGLAQRPDPYAHPLFLRSRLEELGDHAATDEIAETVREVAVLRHAHPRQHEARRQEAAAVDRALHEAELRRAVEAGADIEDLIADSLRRGERIAELESQVLELEQNVEDLRRELAAAREELTARPAPPPDPAKAKSVYDAIVAAETAGHPRLRFTDDCRETAAASPFRNIPKVAQLLAAAQEVAEMMFTAGGDPRAFFKERGFDFKPHISDTARGKSENHYTYTVKGQRRIVEPHITIGRGGPIECLSAYFLIDRDEKVFWFVRLGEHPPVENS